MMRTHFRRSLAAAILLCAACTNASPGIDPEIVSAAQESALLATAADRLRADVNWLADDARQGRETGTQGYVDAAEYVAARMEFMGLEPAGEKGWFQKVPFRTSVNVLDAASVTVTGPDGNSTELVHLDDYRVFPSIKSDRLDLSAPAVFVGYGVNAPEAGHNDFEGLDLEGKIAVYFSGAPDFFDSEKRAHYDTGSVRLKEISDRGAVGAVSLFTAAGEERTPWERLIANPKSISMTWVGPDGTPDLSGPKLEGIAILHPDKAKLLFEGAEKSYDEVRAEVDAEGGAPKGFDLETTISMKGALTIQDLESPNVAGLIRGADPALRDEYVVLTAHLDHTGVDQRLIDEGKDGIKNGAVDNALGVAVMLEAARALKDASPARSVVILAVTGEEKGLLGADYFAHFPTVDKEKIVANVNLDMPVMLHSFTDVVVFGAERTTLGPITRHALEAAGITMSPDPFPQLGVFTRSDHYRFVEQGVPAVYLFPGFANGGEEKFDEFMKEYYHKPGDEPSLPILYEDVARFAEVNFDIALGIANAEERPLWNEGDFFGDLFAGD